MVQQFSKTGSVITLGNFDGVHLGHAALINRTIQLSQQLKIPSVLVTYHPNPAIVLGKRAKLRDIFSFAIKRNIINHFGIDYFYPIPFTRAFADISAQTFLQDYLLSLFSPRKIIIGYNHCFGKRREGNFEFLQYMSQQYNFDVERVEKVFVDGQGVSSTRIRECIDRGDIEQANRLLGRVYYLRGKVIKGFQRGRTIGFPTANLQLDFDNIIIPKKGVYAVFINIHNNLYEGMVNIGNNPTFGNRGISIEGNVFDFNEDLYEQTIEFYFVRHLRDEKKFAGMNELKAALQQDKQEARQMLRNCTQAFPNHLSKYST